MVKNPLAAHGKQGADNQANGALIVGSFCVRVINCRAAERIILLLT